MNLNKLPILKKFCKQWQVLFIAISSLLNLGMYGRVKRRDIA